MRGAFPSSFRVLFDTMRDVPLRRVFPFSTRRGGISPPLLVYWENGMQRSTTRGIALHTPLPTPRAKTTTAPSLPSTGIHTIISVNANADQDAHTTTRRDILSSLLDPSNGGERSSTTRHLSWVSCRARHHPAPFEQEKTPPLGVFLARHHPTPSNMTRHLLKVFCRARHPSSIVLSMMTFHGFFFMLGTILHLSSHRRVSFRCSFTLRGSEN